MRHVHHHTRWRLKQSDALADSYSSSLDVPCCMMFSHPFYSFRSRKCKFLLFRCGPWQAKSLTTNPWTIRVYICLDGHLHLVLKAVITFKPQKALLKYFNSMDHLWLKAPKRHTASTGAHIFTATPNCFMMAPVTRQCSVLRNTFDEILIRKEGGTR
jgi:hypothetical protein